MSNKQALLNFAAKMNKITDSDYGDFKRKTQSYLNSLKKELQNPSNEEAHSILKIESLLSYQGDEQDIDHNLMKIQSYVDALTKH